MPTFALTIGGVTKTMRAGSFSMSETANGMTSVRFSVDSTDGSYRPAVDSEVTITVDGTLVFGGFVDRPTERGIFSGAKPAIRTEISATDYSQYPQRRIIPDGGFPAGYTLLQALTALMTWLTPFGVTLDPAQVTGPTLPELVYKYKTVSDVLNELATVSGTGAEPFVWRISPAKVFGMYQPSTVAAPFNVTTNTPSQVVGDITVDSNQQYYANRIYLKTPDKTEAGRIETFTGDGSTTAFTTLYTPTKTYGTVGVTSNPNETLNNTGDADAATWTYDATTKTITRNAGAPGIGEVVSFKFDGTYSGVAMAEDASVFTSPWERVKVIENVPDDTTLQALADAELARCLPLTKTVKYATFESGLRPGQSQTINVPRRNINDTGIITDVNSRDVGKDRLLRDVTVLFDAQTNVGRDFRATIKQWSGDTNGSAAGSSSVVGPAAPTAGGPGNPNRSVQFNKSGAFGGDAEFIYYHEQDSIVCGGSGSSIDAAAFASSQVWGQDTHIADALTSGDVAIDEDFESSGLSWPSGFFGFGTRTASGVGVDGGWGVESYGFLRHLAYFQTPLALTGRCGSVSVDVHALYSGEGTVDGLTLFGLVKGFDTIGQLVFDVGADHTQLQLVSSAEVVAGPFLSVVGANPDPGGAYRHITLRYRMSSLTESSPGVWTPVADGIMVGYVNDVEVVRASNITLAVDDSFAGSDDNQPDLLRVYPVGAADNLLVTSSNCGAVRAAVFGVTTTVAADRSVAFGLDGATNVFDKQDTLGIFGDLWVSGTITAGGGLAGEEAPPTSWSVLVADGELVFADGDVVMVPS